MINSGKKNIFWRVFTYVIGAIFVALCGVIIYFNVTHEYHVVSGTSMLPTLNVDNTTDGVFVSRVKEYNRGDIIVVRRGEKDENNQEIIVIKRLIAVGGDKITVREIDGENRIVLILNGQTSEMVLDEPYLQDYSANDGLKSRFQTMLHKLSLYPDVNGFITIPQDEIFYLGDNRISSKDCVEYGPVKRDMVVGLVDYIAYGNKNIYWQVIKQVFGG